MKRIILLFTILSSCMVMANRIQLSDIEESLKEIVVITIDDETYKALDGVGVIQSLALFQHRLTEVKVRSLGYDIEFTENYDNLFYQEVLKSRIPTVFSEPNWLTRQSEYQQLNLPTSHPFIKVQRVKNSTEYEERNSRVGKESIIMNGVTEEYGDRIPFASSILLAGDRNSKTPRRYHLDYFSEKKIEKIPLQDILLEVESIHRLKDKYILVGGDHKDLDITTSIKGEKVNGVFLHAILVAMALSTSEDIAHLHEFLLPDKLPF